MPRPSKNITPGSLTDPIPAARSTVWRKHAGPEHAAQYEPDGSILVDAMTHETVAQIDLTEVEARKAKADPQQVKPDPVELAPKVSYVWTSERAIEGRTYRRTDMKVPETV